MVGEIFSLGSLAIPNLEYSGTLQSTWIFIVLFILVEWLGRKEKYSLVALLSGRNRWVRWTVYYLLVFVIIEFSGQQQDFIYFQF